MSKELPKDWKWVKVGDYVISVKGKKPKRVSKVKTKECSMPYVNIKAFEKNIIDEYTDGVGCALCEDGDFLMVWDGSRSGYVGKAIKGALGSTLVKLNFPDIENNYAYYFLQSKFIEINTRAKGVGIPHVDPNILWNYNLLIPPKATQQAIVSKIEELFSELDKGIESLRTAQQQLKTYRQSVLKWAFEGKLTNSLNYDSYDLGDEHDLNMAAEPEAEYKIKKNQGNQNNQINHSSDKGELPKGWKWVKIEDATISLDNKRKPINKEERKKRHGNIPYYGANGQVGWIDDYIFNEPLVCVVEDETFTGREIPFSYKITGKAWVNNHAHVLKPKNDLNIDYLNYQLFYYPFLRLTTGTTGRKKLTKNALSNAPIKICTLEEQNMIVQEIESRLSVADKMQESISQSLQQAEALRQSILKKAFEGKLIKN